MTSTLEFPFTWTCPTCRHVQTDTVNPDLGPYLNIICRECQNVIEEQELDATSAQSWNEAMTQASPHASD